MTPNSDYTEQILARFGAARLWAAHRAPYLASAVFALRPVPIDSAIADENGVPVPDPEFRAFPADTRWNVHLEAGTTLATPVPEIGWWLLHHVGHLVRDHAMRSPLQDLDAGHTHAAGETGAPEAQRWNQAADAEINDDLIAEGMAGPAGVVSPVALGLPTNRMAEEYLPLVEVLAEAMGRGGRALAEAIDCGSAADGRPRDYEDSGSNDGPTELDRELLQRSIVAGLRDRISARSAVPAGWQRWAEQRLTPAVNWRTRLRALLRRGLATSAGKVDFSYRKASRRAGAYAEVVPPAMVAPVPDTVVVVDTSGSVTTPVLERLIAEIDAMINSVTGPDRRLRALCCDIQAHPVQSVRSAAEIELVGGGGTDMSAGIEAAVALRPRPDLVVVLTDGVTDWPQKRPRSPVVVCLIGTDGQAPDWAAIARIPAEGPA